MNEYDDVPRDKSAPPFRSTRIVIVVVSLATAILLAANFIWKIPALEKLFQPKKEQKQERQKSEIEQENKSAQLKKQLGDIKYLMATRLLRNRASGRAAVRVAAGSIKI